MAQDSIFTKIIKGEIPSNKVYEDEHTYAFLDHNPKTPGHTLVITKKQVAYVWELPDEDYIALMNTVKRVAQRIKEEFAPKAAAAPAKTAPAKPRSLFDRR